jgi:hypothetical protein
MVEPWIKKPTVVEISPGNFRGATSVEWRGTKKSAPKDTSVIFILNGQPLPDQAKTDEEGLVFLDFPCNHKGKNYLATKVAGHYRVTEQTPFDVAEVKSIKAERIRLHCFSNGMNRHFKVEVLGQEGKPVAGIPVTFESVGIFSVELTTDKDGTASHGVLMFISKKTGFIARVSPAYAIDGEELYDIELLYS